MAHLAFTCAPEAHPHLGLVAILLAERDAVGLLLPGDFEDEGPECIRRTFVTSLKREAATMVVVLHQQIASHLQLLKDHPSDVIQRDFVLGRNASVPRQIKGEIEALHDVDGVGSGVKDDVADGVGKAL